jgi:hypothetical protein
MALYLLQSALPRRFINEASPFVEPNLRQRVADAMRAGAAGG